jgi:predicted PurR-regulated permease PerM
MGGTLGLYASGVVVNGAIVALGSTTVLWFLHVPYPMILGLLQGLLVAVPYLGTLVAVVTAGGVVLAAQGWQRAAEAIALLSVMEGFEGSFISPLIFKKRLNLNPLTAVLATAAGGTVLGVMGVVLPIPAAAHTTALATAHALGNGSRQPNHVGKASRELLTRVKPTSFG